MEKFTASSLDYPVSSSRVSGEESMLKRTPLFAAHQKAGARLTGFGGCEMPVQYNRIVAEPLTVRNAAGLFDISHMGEVSITGPEAAGFINWLLTNDIRKAPPGHGQYTLMCNENGGVVDDLYAYHLAPEEFLLVINASRIDEDTAWMDKQLLRFPGRQSVHLQDLSEQYAAVALQGPKTASFIDDCFPGRGESGRKPSELKKNEVDRHDFRGSRIFVARTGYTGEDGFEVIAPS